ncbi:hypothetical protein DFO59_11271 [Pseudomonas fluorescens]|nr:hypothetical protein DFO59_11271 [Pseudomonas fluorescens]
MSNGFQLLASFGVDMRCFYRDDGQRLLGWIHMRLGGKGPHRSCLEILDQVPFLYVEVLVSRPFKVTRARQGGRNVMDN